MDFDARFEPKDALDEGEGKALAVEHPETKYFVVKSRIKRVKLGFRVDENMVNDVKTYPMEPPGGMTDTSLSNALQLFVYKSRTSSLGLSAFLLRRTLMYRGFSPGFCAGWGWRLYNRFVRHLRARVMSASVGPNEITASHGEGHIER